MTGGPQIFTAQCRGELTESTQEFQKVLGVGGYSVRGLQKIGHTNVIPNTGSRVTWLGVSDTLGDSQSQARKRKCRCKISSLDLGTQVAPQVEANTWRSPG